MNDNLISFNSSIAIYAFRYCLGRKTYAVSDCVDYLIKYWDYFSDIDKQLIHKEIKNAIFDNKIGNDIDKQEWTKILNLSLVK